MKGREREEDIVNIRTIFDRLLASYIFFIIALVICIGLGIVFYKLLPKKYEVSSTLQLKDQSLINSGSSNDKFISGLELLGGDAEIEDEIGILSSFNLTEKVVDKLDFYVSTFEYTGSLGPLGEKMEEEIYKEKIFITLDKEKPQVTDKRIFLTFSNNAHFTVRVEEEDGYLFDLTNHRFVKKIDEIKVNQRGIVGEWVSTPYFTFKVDIDSSLTYSDDQRFFFVIQDRESLGKEYNTKLNISPISKESNIVRITTLGRVAQKEIDFLNTLCGEYIRNDFAKKNKLGLQTIAFIDEQLELIHDSLATAEKNLKSFRSANQIIDISTTAKDLNEQLTNLEHEHAELKVRAEFFDYTLKYLKENDAKAEIVAPSSVGINDPFLNSLLVQLADLYREKVEKSFSSSSSNPVSQLVESKIANLKKAILDNIQGLISSNDIALNENESRIAALQQRINRLPESERNLININRKFILNDNIYNYLLEKRAEAGIALASNYPDKSIVDSARKVHKKPVSPNLLLILIASIVAGLAIPIGIIVLKEFLNNKVSNKSELERLTDLKVVGVINAVPKAYYKNGFTSVAPQEAFKFLAINIRQLYNLESSKVIGFSSAQQGDGKSFCALNTAITFARSGRRTLYVDADLLKDKKHSLLQEEPGGGTLLDFFTADEPLTSIIRPSQIKNLYVLPSGDFDKDNEHVVHANERKLDYLFLHLKKNFDIVVVDTPPLTMMADYFALSRYFDINLIVVRHNATDKRLLEEAVPLLKLRSLKNLGLVFNDVKMSKTNPYPFNYQSARLG